ncbi:MAG TPA: sigma-70 family RNA polymerase sigma factor [Thermoanaerobaculia bacterium]|nr:sigma-70 family RNA polymerase sigma factor [Thermoanaerobaculia bacterium]
MHDARELLAENRLLIEKAVAFACRRYRLSDEHADEFASLVNVKLIENDYAVLRAFQGRSSLATFLSSVVQHLALDYCNHVWGKWRASAEAERLGPLAVALEQLLYREGHTFDEALAVLAAKHEGATRASLHALFEQIPRRAPRHRDVPLEEAETYARTGLESVESRVVADERRVLARRVSAFVSAHLAELNDEDRLVMQMRFEQEMSVPQIARMLGREQKLLYRVIEKREKELGAGLQRAGFHPRELLDLIGHEESFLAFCFGNRPARPSISNDEQVASQSEEIP